MREEFGDDYLIINGAIFLSEIKTYLLRSCLWPVSNDSLEQQAICNFLLDLDGEVQALQNRHNKTRQIKQGMMQELLTGKTRLVQPEVTAWI